MNLTIYNVASKGNKWAVVKEGGIRASSTHRKKSAAKRRAKNLAKNRRPSQVILYFENGMIEDRETYR